MSVVLLLAAVACDGGGVRDPAFGMMSTSATLSSIQSTVFSPSCALTGCHAGPGPARELDLSEGQSFRNLVGVSGSQLPSFLRVKPRDAENSYLFMKVSGDSRIEGFRMPRGGPVLGDAQLEAIAMWIENGAPNN